MCIIVLNMKFRSSKFFILLFFCLISTLFYSCFKTENFIKGDAKIRFYNTVRGPKQDFYLDSSRLAIGVDSIGNSEYIVVEGDRAYDVLSKNTGLRVANRVLKQNLEIGNHYSVYYTKKSATDSLLIIYKDTLTLDKTKTRVQFMNFGYTLKSNVIITIQDSLGTTNKSLAYGQRSGYFFVKTGPSSKISLRLADSTTTDTIAAASFIKNKAYTIIIDGFVNGKLRERLVPNN